MDRYLAFLRGINVGGHAVMTMEALREAFSGCGCTRVQTAIQSGNVLFDAHGSDLVQLQQRIQVQACQLTGGELALMLRSMAELQELVRRNPFGQLAPVPDDKRHVSCLACAPSAPTGLPLHHEKEGPMLFDLQGQEAFAVSARVNGRFGFPITSSSDNSTYVPRRETGQRCSGSSAPESLGAKSHIAATAVADVALYQRESRTRH